MNISYLNEFTVLAYHLNFSAAARELHISQPTLSGHIATLEKELGVQLFERDRQHVSLTVAGKRCLRDADNVLKSYNDLLRHARQSKTNRAKKVVVQTYAGHRYLSELVHSVAEAPAIADAGVEVELKDLPRIDFFSDVRERAVDIVLILDTFDTLPDEFEAADLGEEPLAAIVSNASPLAGKRVIGARDLDGFRITVPGMPSNHWLADTVSRILEEASVAADIGERYYRSVSELYRQGEANDVFIDALSASCSMPIIMQQSHTVVPLDADTFTLRRTAIYRKDNDNPWLDAVIEELNRARKNIS